MSLFRLARLTFYAFFLVAVGVGYYVYIQALQQPLTNREHKLVVPEGVGVAWLAEHLVTNDIIENKYVLRLYAKFNKSEQTIKAGEYTLIDINSIPELITKVSQGKVIQYSLTLIEGWTFKQFLAHLHQQKGLNKELIDLSDSEIMQRVGAQANLHPEGQFAPETYFYQKGDSDLVVLKQAHKRLTQQLDEVWQQRDKDLPLKTPYELLTLASIIEKETGADYERPIISGVFHNRLKIGMKLQTDPTVIYGMGEAYKGNIRRKDLRTDTPYNTYTRYGLPPSPIAMAGLASLQAAAHPEATPAFYFVGKGDGTHSFSKTLKQHNNAVVKYQLNGKKR